MRGTAIICSSLIAWTAAAADAPIAWSEAENHVGERMTIEGRVLGIHCSPTSCLLAFDPTFNRFTAVVQAKDFKTLTPETLDADYVGRRVRVQGTIQLLDRKPEIVVERAEDLQLVITPQDRENQRATAQMEVTARLDEILDRLDDLAGRLNATQQRLEQVAAAVAQQSTQLAAIAEAANVPPPVEPEPTYGAPQPRPAFEALRTLKRGMTSDQVARLVGPPLTSESNLMGGFIWDYGRGRSVTFDRRNRVTSLSGFPEP